MTVDLRKLVAEIAAGRSPVTLIEPNMAALNALALAFKREKPTDE